MDQTHTESILAQFRAWNSRDVGRLTSSLSPGYQLESDTNQSPVVGVEGLRQHAAALFAAFPDLRFDLADVVGSGDLVAVTWTASGTHRGEFLGVLPTGRRMQVHGCTVTRFERDHIHRQQTYWDVATMLRQLGTPVARRAVPMDWDRSFPMEARSDRALA
jgi:steroid delta-isomerase-like uncharacterized protein